MTIADFALATACHNLLLDTESHYYQDFERIIRKHQIFKAYTAHLKGELADYFASKTDPNQIN